jgi:hypothetical protein
METSGVSLLCQKIFATQCGQCGYLAGSQRKRFQIGTPFCGFRTLVSAPHIVAGKLQK